MKTLITAGSQAAAYKVERTLPSGTACYLGDNANFPLPRFPEGRFVVVPKTDSPSFIHDLLTLCLDLDIGVVYPLRSGEQEALREATALFDEFEIRLVILNDDIVR